MNKKLYKIILIVGLCGILTLGLSFFDISQNVKASSTSGAQSINENKYWTVSISISGNGYLSYTIEVTSGPNVDIILFNETNYAQYSAGEQPQYLVGGSELDISYVEKRDVALSNGTYYLVVDNTDFGSARPPMNGDPAIINYNIEYFSTSKEISNFFVGLLCIVVITVIVIIVVSQRRQKKKQSAQHPLQSKSQSQKSSKFQTPQHPKPKETPPKKSRKFLGQ